MNREVKEQILQKIKEYDRIMIFRHVRNDGDCVGATKGLKRIIQLTWPEKEVYLIDKDTSAYLAFLGPEDEPVEDALYADALGIVLDTASEARISNKNYKLCRELIKIDHHIPLEGYGSIQWVEEDRSSACEMVVDFYSTFRDELKIDSEAATYLYTGMVTDSGRFKYDGVTGDTLRNAAVLLDIGVDTQMLFARLYLEAYGYLKFKAHIYDRMQITENGVAYIYIDRAMQEEFSLSLEQHLLDGLHRKRRRSRFHSCPAAFSIRPHQFRCRKISGRRPRLRQRRHSLFPGGSAVSAGGCRRAGERIQGNPRGLVMNILITNDDSVTASQLLPLIRWCQKLGDVTTVVPMVEQSGKSHGIEIHKPFAYRQVELAPGVTVTAVDSTPADCVRFAVLGLKKQYDLVISGINRGFNIGADVMYSGTVAAVIEAAVLGLHGIYNINIPPQPKGIRFAHQGGPYYSDDFLLDGNGMCRPLGKCVYEDSHDLSLDTDAVMGGYITIMPLTVNMTDMDVYEKLKSMNEI